jgi:hypothetical protein
MTSYTLNINFEHLNNYQNHFKKLYNLDTENLQEYLFSWHMARIYTVTDLIKSLRDKNHKINPVNLLALYEDMKDTIGQSLFFMPISQSCNIETELNALYKSISEYFPEKCEATDFNEGA